jgi:negative regulator of sigma E activity
MVAISGDLEGRCVLQMNGKHYVKPPDGVYVRAPLPPDPGDVKLLLKNYRLRQMRVEPIAGRRCVMISIEPRYDGNPRKLVWLDLRTAMPLRTQVFGIDGYLTEEVLYHTIQYSPRSIPAQYFQLPHSAIREEWPEVRPDFKVMAVRPGDLPPGYRPVKSSVRRLPNGHVVSFQRFFDGLNTLTLLQSRTHANLESVGGDAALGGKVGNVFYVICGDQQAQQLRRMSDALRATQRQPLASRHRSR